jgi:hypothetical protein
MSKVITTSGLRAAILNSTKMQVMFDVGRRFSCVGEPAYIVSAFGIAFLSSIRPKLLLLPIYRPPCWTQGVVNKASRVALHFLALVVPDSIIIAFEIFFVPNTARYIGTSVLLPPSWISGWTVCLTMSALAPLRSLTRKHGVAAGILFLSAL